MSNDPQESNRNFGQSSMAFSINAVLASVGMIANTLVMAVLSKSTKSFSILMVRTWQHQSFLDGTVCLLSFITSMQKITKSGFFVSGIDFFDTILCHTLNDQFLYWLFAVLSAQNLVLLAVERYIAVCRPFTYIQLRPKLLYGVFILMYCFAYLTVFSFSTMTRYTNGTCTAYISAFVDGNDVSTAAFFFLNIQPYVWYAFYFCIPVITMIFLYGRILITLQKSRSVNRHSSNATIGKAAAQITKTAIAVTILYMLSIGYDATAYILITHDVIQFRFELYVLGIIAISLNSLANPFIYAICMPLFRQRLCQVLCSCKCNDFSTKIMRTGHKSSNQDVFTLQV